MPKSTMMKSVMSLIIVLSVSVSTGLGAQGENPVPKLMQNLDSDNVRVAAAAARSLGVIFAPGGKTKEDPQPVIAKLIEQLDSPLGYELREQAAWALGMIRAKQAIDPLKEAMDDKDVNVAMAAGEAIARIAPVDEARAYLIERGKEESEAVKVGAYYALAPIARPEDAEFLAAGLTVDNWRVQKAAIEGLERAVRAGAKLEPKTYDAVAGVLGNEILNASNAASRFLSNLRNEECVRATIAAAKLRGDGSSDDASWRSRAAALRTIDRMGWPTVGEALPVIIRNLGDPTANVSNAARNILYRSEKDNYLSFKDLYPQLVTEWEQAEPLWMKAGIMREMRGQVPKQFASKVAKLAADTLKAALEDKSHWPARAYAVELLGRSGTTDSIEMIASCVADDVSNVRLNAGEALKRLAPLCSAEVKAKVPPLLMPLLKQPDDWRKTAIAARSVGYFPTPDTVPPLTKLLSHSVINVQEGAAHSLSHMVRSDKDLRPLIEKTVHAILATDQRSWEYGSKVIGTLGNPEAIPLLIPILQRGDWRAQTNAALAVAKIGTHEKLENKLLSEALIKASQSEVLQVQDAANKALRYMVKTK